jgi:hypothetical protein
MRKTFKDLYENLKGKMGKLLDLFLKAYVKHPNLTPALTYLSLAIAQTALGAYLGDKLIGGYTVTTGQPAHWEPVYKYVKVGRETKPFFDVSLGYLRVLKTERSIYKAIKIGERWVESTLKTHYQPRGAMIGAVGGFLSSMLTTSELGRLVQRFKRRGKKEK